MMKKQYNSLELFAGCGGLLEGLKQTKLYNVLGCVEWEAKQCSVLKNRLNTEYGISDTDKRVLRFDIQRTEELFHGWKDEVYGESEGLDKLIGEEKVDVITGGPPCQAYSLAGRIQDKDGMKNDYRNYLFESYLKVVDRYKPSMFVFENVEGILSAKPDGFNIMDKIKSDFREHGYDIIEDVRKYALLDLSEYGIPQRRKRVILVSLNKEEYGDTQELLVKFYTKTLPSYLEKTGISVRDAISDLPKLIPTKINSNLRKRKLSHTYNSKFVELGHVSRFHNERDIEIFKMLANDIESGKNEFSTTASLQELYTRMTGNESNVHKYNVLNWDKPSNTIPAHLKKDGLRHIHPDPNQGRTITVREAARLQTFPDSFIFSGSMTKDFEMIGNAVPPKFAFKLGNAIKQLLSCTYVN